MSASPTPHNAETTRWLATLTERAEALERKFACGGTAIVPAPLVLRGPDAQRIEVVERGSILFDRVGDELARWCAPASFGVGSETRTESRVRDGRQLYARNGALGVEGFDEALRDILRDVRASLCPHHAKPPIAVLHSLNIYGPGGHFVTHKDTPRDPDVFGTLVVCLPLAFEGGKLVVVHGSRAIFDWAPVSGMSFAKVDPTGRQIRWAAFFGDVDHFIEPVRFGCRATLTYELRRSSATEGISTETSSEAEAAFSGALIDALEDPKFAPRGMKLGVPCLHLYTVSVEEPTLRDVEHLHANLKGRDGLVASALERAGILPRVVPYVFETCAGGSWRLRRDANIAEQDIFKQSELVADHLEQTLPIDFRAGRGQRDDVTWLLPPPWITRRRDTFDGQPDPETRLLGEVDYSISGYFGNESAPSSFYSTAAILFDVSTRPERERAHGAVHRRQR